MSLTGLCSLSVTVGNPAYLSDETKELTLRVHDECMRI